jgi:hypothetical protein
MTRATPFAYALSKHSWNSSEPTGFELLVREMHPRCRVRRNTDVDVQRLTVAATLTPAFDGQSLPGVGE